MGLPVRGLTGFPVLRQERLQIDDLLRISMRRFTGQGQLLPIETRRRVQRFDGRRGASA